ncbi:hypothetical protein V1460_20060 [Streptomyces sp. SCSIO 30461]|uniref:hypothetical protein n=1 Tax=Streptomyces sp. SCSIO 30461 TaxID=3118085 RepID=UPI0030D2462A
MGTDIVDSAVAQLHDRRLATVTNNLLVLTDEGRNTKAGLERARHQALAALLGDWDPEEHADLAMLLSGLGERPLGDEEGRT